MRRKGNSIHSGSIPLLRSNKSARSQRLVGNESGQGPHREHNSHLVTLTINNLFTTLDLPGDLIRC